MLFPNQRRTSAQPNNKLYLDIFQTELAISRLDWPFTTKRRSHKWIASQHCYRPPRYTRFTLPTLISPSFKLYHYD